MTGSEYVTVQETAEILSVSYGRALEFANVGNFERTTHYVNGRRMIALKRADVEAFRDKRLARASAPKSKTAELPILKEKMSLEDWYTGQALAGLCANTSLIWERDLDALGSDTTLVELARTARILGALTNTSGD